VGLLNLQLVLRDQGRVDEAGAVAERLAKLKSDPPYKFFDLGLAALRAGQFQEAKRQFKREIERMAFVHEFHFSLALAHYALGELDDARQQLALAREYSVTSQDRLQYDSKLASLRGARSGAKVPG
jgi:Tfp pilus assembly protein PilF